MTNAEVYGALALILMELEKINNRLDNLNNAEVQYDAATLNKVSELVDEIRDSVHLSNSPYSNNEQIVNPYLDAVQDEIDSLRKESK